MSILDSDATALAEQIRTGKISSVAATDTYIAQLKAVNPHLNCLVEDRFATARQEAIRADEQLQREKNEQRRNGEGNGRLFGVPISVKESFDVAGMRTTGGIVARKDYVAEVDSDVVAKLKAAGAIILGKTNTPVLCFCQESDNKLYGRTNNPWDVTKTAGGSSGGEGALIAAGGAAVGVGSDIGGSIRFPSHFNGVVGFKSGNAQVSQRGSFPFVDIALQARMLGIGAMAKSVRDARLINEIIAAAPPTGKVRNSNALDLKAFDLKALDLKSWESFEVVIPRHSIRYPLDEVTRALLAQVSNRLAADFSVRDEQPPLYEQAALLWQLIMSIDGAEQVAATAFCDRPVRPIREFLREKVFKRSELHDYFTWAIIGARLFKPNAARLTDIEATLQAGDEQLAHYFQNRVLILPVYHTPAPAHGQVYKQIFSIRKKYLSYMPYAAYANVWGLPALTVPVGTSSDGLPIAVQVVSSVGNEDAIFALGERIEQKFRGYVRCQAVAACEVHSPA